MPIEIQTVENGHRLILNQKKANVFIQVVLGILTAICVLTPIVVLFSPNASSSMIVGAIISGLFSVFLLRLFLWNAFGKEVFEIKAETVSHYTDYKIFKDKLFESDEPSNLCVDIKTKEGLSEKELLSLPAEENANQDSALLYITISDAKAILSQSHIPLNKSERDQVTQVFNSAI